MGSDNDFNIFKTYVTMVERMGLDTYIYFNIQGRNCVAKMNVENSLRIGDYISCYIDKEKIHLFDCETNLRNF